MTWNDDHLPTTKDISFGHNEFPVFRKSKTPQGPLQSLSSWIAIVLQMSNSGRDCRWFFYVLFASGSTEFEKTLPSAKPTVQTHRKQTSLDKGWWFTSLYLGAGKPLIAAPFIGFVRFLMCKNTCQNAAVP